MSQGWDSTTQGFPSITESQPLVSRSVKVHEAPSREFALGRVQLRGERQMPPDL